MKKLNSFLKFFLNLALEKETRDSCKFFKCCGITFLAGTNTSEVICSIRVKKHHFANIMTMVSRDKVNLLL